ncbi:SGNH/GDSL hydrolase family protein [Parablautia intestinalis]|uniref:SGNH/GDSL hydrolase family protein n=1 Tax=Parablautia intestinalis TaxID=2320100 RepID=UPI00256EE9BE|nr:SGNH/GDSL hydrolase family protein [Parablautia intestinalis]
MSSKRVKKCLLAILLFIIIILLGSGFIQRHRGNTIKILIVGDSIGEGAGASDPSLKWYKYLIPYMKDTYGVNLDITNISMGGNTSYAGYARVMMLDDKENYDLAIVCYGENDKSEDFSLYYESILWAIRYKFPDSKMITILESSQRDYTAKIKVIQDLSEHYDAYVADTIAAFRNSGRAYEELCDDGTHPNDEGQRVYYETVKPLVSELYKKSEQTTKQEIEAVNKELINYEKFRYYSLNEFKKIDEYTYELESVAAGGILGIDYTCVKGESRISIYINDQNLCDKQLVWENDFTLRFIEEVTDKVETDSKLRLVFSSKEQAKAFHGIIINTRI